jgi:hypothetical protein
MSFEEQEKKNEDEEEMIKRNVTKPPKNASQPALVLPSVHSFFLSGISCSPLY